MGHQCVINVTSYPDDGTWICHQCHIRSWWWHQYVINVIHVLMMGHQCVINVTSYPDDGDINVISYPDDGTLICHQCHIRSWWWGHQCVINATSGSLWWGQNGPWNVGNFKPADTADRSKRFSRQESFRSYRINSSIFSKVLLISFPIWLVSPILLFLSELILSTCSFQFLQHWSINSVINLQSVLISHSLCRPKDVSHSPPN
jgi:hypothetical protein